MADQPKYQHGGQSTRGSQGESLQRRTRSSSRSSIHLSTSSGSEQLDVEIETLTTGKKQDPRNKDFVTAKNLVSNNVRLNTQSICDQPHSSQTLSNQDISPIPIKRPRGRPRKYPIDQNLTTTSLGNSHTKRTTNSKKSSYSNTVVHNKKTSVVKAKKGKRSESVSESHESVFSEQAATEIESGKVYKGRKTIERTIKPDNSEYCDRSSRRKRKGSVGASQEAEVDPGVQIASGAKIKAPEEEKEIEKKPAAKEIVSRRKKVPIKNETSVIDSLRSRSKSAAIIIKVEETKSETVSSNISHRVKQLRVKQEPLPGCSKQDINSFHKDSTSCLTKDISETASLVIPKKRVRLTDTTTGAVESSSAVTQKRPNSKGKNPRSQSHDSEAPELSSLRRSSRTKTTGSCASSSSRRSSRVVKRPLAGPSGGGNRIPHI